MAVLTERAHVKNAADERQVRGGDRREQQQIDRDKSDIQIALSHPPARRLVARILDAGMISTTCSSRDPIEMARLNGCRDLALWLEREIMLADAKLMPLIRLEAERLARIDDAALDPDDADG